MSESGGERCEEKTDPGAIRHGNFMNYYQFHAAEERVRQLPRGVWQRQRVAHPARKYAGLDVGCNAGVSKSSDNNSCRGRQTKRDNSAFVIRKLARLILVELSPFRFPLAQQASAFGICILCPQKFPARVRLLFLPLPRSSFTGANAFSLIILLFPVAYRFLLAGDFLLARSGTSNQENACN